MNKVIKDLGMKVKIGTVKRAHFYIIECPDCTTHFEVRKDSMKILRRCKSCASIKSGLDPNKSEIITQSVIKMFFAYDYSTGDMTWRKKVSPRSRTTIGALVGTLHPSGYRVVQFRGCIYPVHRLIFMYVTGVMPNVIDHKNHIRDDNKWNNLKESSYSENNKNALKRKDNTSGVTGVSWHRIDKVWVAFINVDGAILRLGASKDKNKMIAVRKQAEITYKYSKTHGTEL